MRKSVCRFVAVVSAAILPFTALAQNFLSGPTTGADWPDPSNWNLGTTPGTTTDAYLGYTNVGVPGPLFTGNVRIWQGNAHARNVTTLAPISMKLGQLDLYGDLKSVLDPRNATRPPITLDSSRIFFQTSAELDAGSVTATAGVSYLDIWTGQTLTITPSTNIGSTDGILRQTTYLYRPGSIMNFGGILSRKQIQLTPSALYNFELIGAYNYQGFVDKSMPNLEIATHTFENWGSLVAWDGSTVNIFTPEFMNFKFVSNIGSSLNFYTPEFYDIFSATGAGLQSQNGGLTNIFGNLHLYGTSSVKLGKSAPEQQVGYLDIHGNLYANGAVLDDVVSGEERLGAMRFVAPLGSVRSVVGAAGSSAFFASLHCTLDDPLGPRVPLRLSGCRVTDGVFTTSLGQKLIMDNVQASLVKLFEAEISYPGYRVIPHFIEVSRASNQSCFLVLNQGQNLATFSDNTDALNLIEEAFVVVGDAQSEFTMRDARVDFFGKISLVGIPYLKTSGRFELFSNTAPPVTVSDGTFVLRARNQQPFWITLRAQSNAVLLVNSTIGEPLDGWAGRVTINPGTTLRFTRIDTHVGDLTGLIKATSMVLNGHLDLSQLTMPTVSAGTVYKLINGSVFLGDKFTYNVPSGWRLSNGPSGVWLVKL